MKNCNCCKHCKKCNPKKWQKVWEVCYDFDSGNGLKPLWVMVFFPIIAPLIYILYYYCERKEK